MSSAAIAEATSPAAAPPIPSATRKVSSLWSRERPRSVLPKTETRTGLVTGSFPGPGFDPGAPSGVVRGERQGGVSPCLRARPITIQEVHVPDHHRRLGAGLVVQPLVRPELLAARDVGGADLRGVVRRLGEAVELRLRRRLGRGRRVVRA